MRYSLRTLLIVMLASGPVCLWVWLVWTAKRETVVLLPGIIVMSKGEFYFVSGILAMMTARFCYPLWINWKRGDPPYPD